MTTLDVIRIHELKLDCIVGIRPDERQSEQTLVIDAQLHLNSRKAGRSGRIADTVDYAQVAETISAMLRFRRYFLIEVAAEELSAMLLGTQSRLEQVQLRLTKPGALVGLAAGASVEVARRRCDFPALQTDDGVGQHLLCREDAELSVVHIPPQGIFEAPVSNARRLDWLIAGRLVGEGRERLPGKFENDGSPAVQWENPEPTAAVVFQCVMSKESRLADALG